MHTYISQHKNSAYFVFILLFIIFLFFHMHRGKYACHTNTILNQFSFILRRSRARGETIQTSINIYFRQSTASQATRLILPLEHQSKEKEAIPASANTAFNALWRIYTSRLCHLCRSLHSVYSFTNHYLTVRTVSLLLQLIT